MVVFFLMVMFAIVVTTVWITKRLLGHDVPAAPKRLVPLDDAPPEVLDAIVRQVRRGPDTV